MFKIQETFKDGYQMIFYSCPHWEVHGYDFSHEDEELILNKCSMRYSKAQYSLAEGRTQLQSRADCKHKICNECVESGLKGDCNFCVN